MKRLSAIVLSLLFAFNGVADDTLVNPKAELKGVVDSVRRRVAMLNVADKPTLPSVFTNDNTLLSASLLRDITQGESLILRCPPVATPQGFTYVGFGEDEDVYLVCRDAALYPNGPTPRAQGSLPQAFGVDSIIQTNDYPFSSFCWAPSNPYLLSTMRQYTIFGIDNVDSLVRRTTNLRSFIEGMKPAGSTQYCLDDLHGSGYTGLYHIDDILTFSTLNNDYAQAMWMEGRGIPHTCKERKFSVVSRAYCTTSVMGQRLYTIVSNVTTTVSTNIVIKSADNSVYYENRQDTSWFPGIGIMTIHPDKNEQDWDSLPKQVWYEPYLYPDPTTHAIGHGIKYAQLAWTSETSTVVANLSFSSYSYEDFANTQGYLDSYYAAMSPVTNAIGNSTLQCVRVMTYPDNRTPYDVAQESKVFSPASWCPVDITNYFNAYSHNCISRIGQRTDCSIHFTHTFNGDSSITKYFSNVYPSMGQQFIRYRYDDVEFDEYIGLPFYFTNDVTHAQILTSCDIDVTIELAPDCVPPIDEIPPSSGEVIRGQCFTFIRFKPKTDSGHDPDPSD